jgi:hypothetical protein
MGYNREKVLTFKYLLYEFLGVAMLTVCYNMTRSYNYFLIVVSIWAWNHSGAHFNMAITFGELIMRSSSFADFTSGFVPFLMISFIQLVGALFGILITFMLSKVTYTNDSKTISPGVPVLCPRLGCSTDYLHWLVFSSELISSFGVIFTFLIIRFTDFGNESRKWMTLIGPFVYTSAVIGCA